MYFQIEKVIPVTCQIFPFQMIMMNWWVNKVRFISYYIKFTNFNEKRKKKEKKEKTAIICIPKNSKGHPKIAGKVPRKELMLSTSTNVSTPNNSEVQARETSKNWSKIKELNKQEQPQTVQSKGRRFIIKILWIVLCLQKKKTWFSIWKQNLNMQEKYWKKKKQ